MTKLTRRQSFQAHLLYAPAQQVEEKTGLTAPLKRAAPVRTHPSEYQEQTAVIDWWRVWGPQHGHDERLLFSIPNGAFLGRDSKQRMITMVALKKNGLRPGASDLMLAIPRAQFHGAFLEMKSLVGRASDDQQDFGDIVTAEGYLFRVCQGAEAAIDTIKEYLDE